MVLEDASADCPAKIKKMLVQYKAQIFVLSPRRFKHTEPSEKRN